MDAIIWCSRKHQCVYLIKIRWWAYGIAISLYDNIINSWQSPRQWKTRLHTNNLIRVWCISMKPPLFRPITVLVPLPIYAWVRYCTRLIFLLNITHQNKGHSTYNKYAYGWCFALFDIIRHAKMFYPYPSECFHVVWIASWPSNHIHAHGVAQCDLYHNTQNGHLVILNQYRTQPKA